MTRHPRTQEYAIVSQFQSGGNLRRVISENHTGLTWQNVTWMFRNISYGLANIHEQEYCHKDLHSGNILSSYGSVSDERHDIFSVISDVGLCRPLDENNEKTLYGVIPFV